jgi:hypothetical protein
MKFKIECEMEARWVPHFVSMLKYMQYLGSVGSSRRVTIYADGDGDFRPRFKFFRGLFRKLKVRKIKPMKPPPEKPHGGDALYDAG